MQEPSGRSSSSSNPDSGEGRGLPGQIHAEAEAAKAAEYAKWLERVSSDTNPSPNPDPKEETRLFEQALAASQHTIGVGGMLDKYIKKHGELSPKEAKRTFAEWARELWKEFAVHGIVRPDKEGRPVLNCYSDLDGKISLELLRLAGINTKDIIYVNPGDSVEGRINLDTGKKHGVVSEGETMTLDHHGEESGNDTCTAKIAYETLTRLGVLEPADYLDKAVEFVTHVDNATFPDEENYFLNSSRTVLGLKRFITPQNLIRFFKEGGSATQELKPPELAKLGLLEKSGKQAKAVQESVQRLMEMEGEGLIINSERYGKIVVDIGKTVPCGFDAAKFWGCGAYLNWSPDTKGFFLSTANELPKEFHLSQGKRIRQTMWLKPLHDQSDLTIKLEEIISAMAGADFEPAGKLKEYLDKERIDMVFDGGRINESKLINKNMPELKPRLQEDMSQEQKDKAYEVAALEAQDISSVQAQAEKTSYAKKIELSRQSETAVTGLLDEEIEAKRREYAVKWFGKHKDQFAGMPVSKFGQEAQIAFVLANWKSVGENGPSPEADMREDEEYKEKFGKEIDNLQALKTGLESPVSLASPFLLLNHLDKSIERKKEELKVAQEKAKGGDKAAASEVTLIESSIKGLYAAAQELAGKTMKENLTEDAEKAATAEMLTEKGSANRSDFVTANLERKKVEVKNLENQRLVDKQYEYFRGLSPEEQKKILPELGERPADVLSPAFTEYLNNFRVAIEARAAKMGIEGEVFYGFLEQGYRPYEATKKGWGILQEKSIVMPKTGGVALEKPVSEFHDSVESAVRNYTRIIESRTRESLEAEWDADYGKKVEVNIKARVKEVATSRELSGEKLEALFAEERSKIVQEFIKKHTARVPEAPKAKEEAESKPRINREAKKSKERRVPFEEIVPDSTGDESGKRGGGLEKLTGQAGHDADILSGYLIEKFGAEEMTPAEVKRVMKIPEYRDAYKGWKEKYGLFDWFVKVMSGEPWKRRRTKKSKK